MRLFVCMGCRAVFLFKQVDKVVCIFVSYHKGDLMNLFICGNEQIDGGFQPFFIEIFKGRHTKERGKLMADSVFAHMISPLYVIKSERFCKAVVQKMFQFMEVGCAFYSIFR